MEENIKIVADFYSSERIIEETKKVQTHKDGLKIWEKDVAAEYFHENEAILDIGCGRGREAFALYDMGFKVTGIDVSDYRIETAKKLALESKREIDFLLTDGLRLPFENGSFDAVILWAQTFGQFYGRENQLKILGECRRVLKSGGTLSFSGHDKEFIERKFPQYLTGKKFFAYADTQCYWEAFTLPELIEVAEIAGFKVLNCGRGYVYREGDGTILHSECLNNTSSCE